MTKLLFVEDDRYFARWAVAEMAIHGAEWQMAVVHDLRQARDWLAKPEAAGCELAVIDLHLGLDSGVDLILELTKTRPEIPILVVTSVNTPDDVFRAIRAGAQGYLLKNAIDGEFSLGVNQLYSGLSPINPGIAHLLLTAFRASDALACAKKNDADCAPQELLSLLSQREAEVLRLLSQGYAYKEIAINLNIAPSTVDTHIRSIYRKFSVSSKRQLRRLLDQN